MKNLKKLLPLLLAVLLTAGCAAPAAETLPPTQPPTQPPTVPVTEEVTEPATEAPTQPEDNRLQEYQDLFRDGVYNLAAGIIYTRPADVNLYYLFYNGVGYDGSWSSVGGADRDLLVGRGFWQECDIQIMPARLLEEKLQRYFGVGLADVRIPGEWAYSAESDTYYSNHNDAFGSGVTVNGFADNDDGTVTLFLTVDAVYDHGTDDYLWDQPMHMTLRETEDGWQMVSNVAANVSASQENMAALAYYQNLLGWSGGMDYFRALGTIFNTAEDVDLYYFFYGGVDVPARWDELEAAERDYLLAEGLWEEFDLQKMPASILQERLQRYFGIGLDDVQIPDRWVYYAPADSYYTNHSDAWLPEVTVTDAEEFQDGTVRVYLTVDMVIDHAGEYVSNAETVLTLRRTQDGSWQMVTHAFAQDVV